jgi:RNA polymerase sigma-70 factor (ECF subfamily)
LSDPQNLARFEQVILPHLDAAYNLARWLTRNDHDAEDIVQEAYLRAFRSFTGFCGLNGRMWLLTIVRNTCYTWFGKNRPHELSIPFDEYFHDSESQAPDPDALLQQKEDTQVLRRALEELRVEFREVLILRTLEDLSYKEIAAVVGIPPGTVMSRLTRARGRLKQILTNQMKEGL